MVGSSLSSYVKWGVGAVVLGAACYVLCRQNQSLPESPKPKETAKASSKPGADVPKGGSVCDEFPCRDSIKKEI